MHSVFNKKVFSYFSFAFLFILVDDFSQAGEYLLESGFNIFFTSLVEANVRYILVSTMVCSTFYTNQLLS